MATNTLKRKPANPSFLLKHLVRDLVEHELSSTSRREIGAAEVRC